MSTARINARTIVLDALRQQEEPMLDLSPVAAARPQPPLVPAPLCASPGCRNLVLERWEESGRFCAKCAIEADLYDRESRRERAFPRLVF